MKEMNEYFYVTFFPVNFFVDFFNWNTASEFTVEIKLKKDFERSLIEKKEKRKKKEREYEFYDYKLDWNNKYNYKKTKEENKQINQSINE